MYLFPQSIRDSFPEMLMRLDNFRMSDAAVGVLRPILVRLKKLCLNWCRLTFTLSKVIANCTELTKIKIIRAQGEKFIWLHLPNLESFSFGEKCLEFRRQTPRHHLLRFLECNPQLRKVAAEHVVNLNNYPEVIRTIAQLQHFESLKISVKDMQLIHLLPLTLMHKLRKLKLLK